MLSMTVYYDCDVITTNCSGHARALVLAKDSIYCDKTGRSISNSGATPSVFPLDLVFFRFI